MTDTTIRETPRSNGLATDSRRAAAKPGRAEARETAGEKIRVFVAAENRLLREALSRVLTKDAGIEVIATDCAATFHTDILLDARPDILLLTSRGSLPEDLSAIQQVRAAA